MSATLAVPTSAVREVAALQSFAPHKKWLPVFTIMCVDVCTFMLSLALSLLVWRAFSVRPAAFSYVQFLVTVAIFVAICAIKGLHRITGVGFVEELRGIVLAVCTAFLFETSVTFLMKASDRYSRGLLVLEWSLAMVTIPIVRLIVRPILGRRQWFARPVAILGAGRTASLLIETLRKNPALALRPVVAFDDDPRKRGSLGGVPVVGSLSNASSFCRVLKIDYAIVAMPGMPRHRLLEVLRFTAASFSRLLLVPDLFGVPSAWVETRDVGGTLGLEIRDNLLHRNSLILKTLLELFVIAMGLPVVLPICVVIAILVKLGSKGPIFYSQPRVGKGGEIIRVWKFRTMLQNADGLLHQFLKENPSMQDEWAAEHKLKNDPRITPIGRFLRHTSLDELPQLWNVIIGQMSLVGPRPIVAAEIGKLGDTYDMYTRVCPGLTGLWQVSGRNDLTYEERVRLNEHYVRNWSVWLDLMILVRTIRVVITAEGAY